MTDKASSGTDSRNHDRLLPCPFCGGEAEYGVTMAGEEVYCIRCGAAMPRQTSRAAAECAWNTRTASGDDFSRAVHDSHLWRRVNDNIKCRNCGLNIESVIPLDGCNRNAIMHCPNCGRRVEHD